MRILRTMIAKEIRSSYRDYIIFLALLAAWILLITIPSNMAVLARREEDLIGHFSLILGAAFSGYWLYSLQREAWSGALYQMLFIPARRAYILAVKLSVLLAGFAATTAGIMVYLSVTGFLWYPPSNLGILWRLNNLAGIPFAVLCCVVLAWGCSFVVVRNRFALSVLVFIVSFLAYHVLDLHIPVSGLNPVVVQSVSFAVTIACGVVTSSAGILFFERFGDIEGLS